MVIEEKTGQIELTLEDRLFRYILVLGILAIFFLILYDLFYTQDYHSVIIECIAGLVFVGYLIAFRNRNITNIHKYLFSILLIIVISLIIALVTHGWGLYSQQKEEGAIISLG